jgi:hypothetical protein
MSSDYCTSLRNPPVKLPVIIGKCNFYWRVRIPHIKGVHSVGCCGTNKHTYSKTNSIICTDCKRRWNYVINLITTTDVSKLRDCQFIYNQLKSFQPRCRITIRISYDRCPLYSGCNTLSICPHPTPFSINISKLYSCIIHSNWYFHQSMPCGREYINGEECRYCIQKFADFNQVIERMNSAGMGCFLQSDHMGKICTNYDGYHHLEWLTTYLAIVGQCGPIETKPVINYLFQKITFPESFKI